MPNLYLIRGAPGSGKSTLARNMLRNREVHVILEADYYFTGKDGKYRFNPNKLTEAHRACLDGAISSMALGWNIAVANTFTKLWEMLPYIEAAEKHGYTVHVVRCTGMWPNVHEVPSAKVEAMRRRMESYPGERFHD